MKKLDLKYRPKTLEEVIGQESTVKILKKNIEDNEIADAYLFYGAHGSGKTTFSRILAMAILCKEKIKPCGKCKSCLGILNKENLNYREEDGGSKGGIEQIREIINESKYKALDGADKKIVVFDEAHGISKAGQNALLKELEEGGGSIYIFCTTEPEKVLPTVTSRCIPFEINKVPLNLIKERLIYICEKENIEYNEKALELLIKARKGHIRDCLKELDKLSSLGPVTLDAIEDFLHADIQNSYFELIYDLKNNPTIALQKLDKLLSRLTPLDIYNGLITASIDVYRNSLNLSTDLTIIDDKILRELWAIYKEEILEISNYLITRKNNRINRTTLICDLLTLIEKAKHNFATQIKVVEKVSYKENTETIQKINVTSNSPIIEDTDVSLFDDNIKSESAVNIQIDSDLKYLDNFKSPLYKQGTSKEFYNPQLRKEKKIRKNQIELKGSKGRFDELTPTEFTREILGGLHLNE